MSDGEINELAALSEQLDEVLQEPILDGEDAIEVAILAGLVERLGGRGEAVDAARQWRDEDGADLLEEYWAEFDESDLVAGIEDVLVGDADEDDVEEAILDVDEHVCAALWSGHASAVRSMAEAVEQSIRTVPDPFACLSDVGAEFSRMPAVARDRELYAYWFAIADSAQWASN